MKILICSLTMLLAMLAIAIPVKTSYAQNITLNFLNNQEVKDALFEEYGKKIPKEFTVETTVATKKGTEYYVYLHYKNNELQFFKAKSELYDLFSFHTYVRYSNEDKDPFIVVFTYSSPCQYPYAYDSLFVGAFTEIPRFKEINLKREVLARESIQKVYFRETSALPENVVLDFKELFPENQ